MKRPVLVATVALAVLGAEAQAQSRLDDYVATAVERNLELRAERLSVRAAEARWDEARAARLPTLDFDARCA